MTSVAIKNQKPVYPLRTRSTRKKELLKLTKSNLIRGLAIRTNFKALILREAVKP